MAATKRTKDQRLFDMAAIERWRVQGKTVRQIADLLAQERPYQISPTQVFKDLKRIEADWIERAQKDIAALKARELRGLDEQESELWAAWEKSKLDAEKTTEENGSGATGPWTKSSTVKERQCGDVSFQNAILAVRAQRAKLLGLEAPSKSELSGPAGVPLAGSGPVIIMEGNGFESAGAPSGRFTVPRELASITDEELAALKEEIERHEKAAKPAGA